MISYNLRIEYLKLMFLDKPIRICTQLNFVEESWPCGIRDHLRLKFENMNLGRNLSLTGNFEMTNWSSSCHM